MSELQPVADRRRNAAGDWDYTDPEEHHFIFSASIMMSVDVSVIDDFLDNAACGLWQHIDAEGRDVGHQQRAALISTRREALDAWRREAIDHSLDIVEDLHRLANELALRWRCVRLEDKCKRLSNLTEAPGKNRGTAKQSVRLIRKLKLEHPTEGPKAMADRISRAIGHPAGFDAEICACFAKPEVGVILDIETQERISTRQLVGRIADALRPRRLANATK